MRKIEETTAFANAIEIIPKHVVQNGIAHLQSMSIQIPNRVIVSIKEGGDRVALDLHKPGGDIQVPLTYMQMKHKDEHGIWQKIPRLISLPDINELIDFRKQIVRELAFAEAVVEGEDTIIGAKKAVRGQFDEYNRKNASHYPYPNFHTIALISKINGDPSIERFIYAFEISKLIYVAGYGCDDGDNGRLLDNIIGRWADGATSIPPGPPYYTQNF